jgi:TIR domain/Domain of unknown function (DUF4384)
MSHNVFISYSSQDMAIADAACNALEAAGIRCWIAPRNIVAGTDWPVAITQAIADCRLVLLIFSAHSNESKEVARELKCAEDGEKVVVPFRIAEVRPTSMLQYYMSATHWLDAISPPLESHLPKLCDTVRLFCPNPDADPAVPPGTAAPPIADRTWKSAMSVPGIRPFHMAVFAGLALVTAVLYWAFASKWAMVAVPSAGAVPAGQPPVAKDGAVSIATEDNRKNYADGEVMRFRVVADRDCFLTLLEIDPQGNATLLVPNAWQHQLRLRKDQPITIPTPEMEFEIFVKPPHGSTTIKAIVTNEPLVIHGLDARRLADEKLVQLGNIRAIGVRANQTPSLVSELAPQSLDNRLGEKGWTMQEMTILTRPK